MRVIPSAVRDGHPDFALLTRIARAINGGARGTDGLRLAFPELMRDAIDFVLDSVRTGRTQLSELDKNEKAFIGLKVEHFVRDYLDVPKGIRDLVIDGLDVDIKNTTAETWMITPETYRTEDPCMVIASEAATGRCWLGLIVARNEYLTAPNRDQKRGVSSAAFKHILWLVEAAPMPPSRWQSINMSEFRELRKVPSGSERAATFFKRNLRRPVHRTVVQALLYDQRDYMKRLRGNGGARDILRKDGIALLSGHFDKELSRQLGIVGLRREEHISVKAESPEEDNLLRVRGLID